MLAEMVICLLFFSICACITLCVYVDAYNRSENALSQQQALVYAQNIAEGYKGSNLPFDEYFICETWGNEPGKKSADVCFSKTIYSFRVSETDDKPGIRGFTLTAFAGGKQKFSFDVEVYNQ